MQTQKEPIVGAWRVVAEGAPFAYHMFVFHSDGTMQQSNPPAGNQVTSDSQGLGVWAARKSGITARFEEVRLEPGKKIVTRGVVDLALAVNGDLLTGSCAFSIYDIKTNRKLAGPLPAQIRGDRVRAPGV